MIPGDDLSLHYSNIKVTVTCKLQRSHVKRRVCPIGFRWRVRKKLVNRHDNPLGMGEEGAHNAKFGPCGLLGHDAAYSGTDLPTFQWNFLASSRLVDIYRPLGARFVSCIRYHEYVGGAVQSSGENLRQELRQST